MNASAALEYRTCMAGIRPCYSDRQARDHHRGRPGAHDKYPDSPAGDVGWLYPADPISQELYLESLDWYNGEMVRDDMPSAAACIRWANLASGSLSAPGKGQQPTASHHYSARAVLNQAPPPPPPPPPPATVDLPALQRRIRQLIDHSGGGSAAAL